MREFRDAAGLTNYGWAKAAGVSESSVREFLNGNNPNISVGHLEKLAGAIGKTAADFLVKASATTRKRGEVAARHREDEFVQIPRFDAAASAGPGSIVDPNAETLGYYYFEAQWLAALTRAASHQLAVIRVAGDSMEPTLADGDWILIDRTQNRPNREGVYAIQVGDIVWVKRITLNLRDKLIQIISDNDRYPMQELAEDELAIIGRAVWIVGRKV